MRPTSALHSGLVNGRAPAMSEDPLRDFINSSRRFISRGVRGRGGGAIQRAPALFFKALNVNHIAMQTFISESLRGHLRRLLQP